MYEVIRWISIVLMWLAVGMNIYAIYRLYRSRKRYEKRENELEAERKYCLSMIAACNEFLEAAHGEVGLTEEAADGLG